MGEEEGEKIKKRGRGREGGKGKKEKENNCIQNVIIKKQKDIAKKNFFLQVQNRVGFPRQSMNAFCVI